MTAREVLVTAVNELKRIATGARDPEIQRRLRKLESEMREHRDSATPQGLWRGRTGR